MISLFSLFLLLVGGERGGKGGTKLFVAKCKYQHSGSSQPLTGQGLLAQLGETGAERVASMLESADATTRVVAFRALRRAGADLGTLAGVVPPERAARTTSSVGEKGSVGPLLPKPTPLPARFCRMPNCAALLLTTVGSPNSV